MKASGLWITGAAIACIGLGACTTSKLPQQQPQNLEDFKAALCAGVESDLCEMRLNALDDMDVAGCTAQGGELVGDGILGLPVCRVSFPDAGKSCGDSDDCQGACIGRHPDQGQPSCQAYAPLFGCYASYEDGEIQYEICVD